MMVGGPLGKARMALAEGRPDEAERLLRKLLDRRSDDVNARLLLAQALLQQSQLDDGVAQIRRILREQPKNVDALLLLSAALVQRGGMRIPKEAEESARRAVQLAPKNARARTQLAEVLTAKQDFPAARNEIDEAIRLEPRLAGAHLMRAVIALSDKDPEGAIQSADSALRYDRTLAQADYIKANALVEVKRYDDALVSLDTATRSNPMLRNAQTHSLRGRIYFRQRKVKQSYAEFLTAQMMSGRMTRLAPAWAAVSMVFSVFGSRAPFVLVGVIVAVVLLILWGISYIPVAGPWIVVALVVILAGFLGVNGLRQLRGTVLPGDGQARLLTLGAVGVALIAGVAIVLAIANGVFHALATPTAIGTAGVVAIVLGGLAAYFFPTVLTRYGGALGAS